MRAFVLLLVVPAIVAAQNVRVANDDSGACTAPCPHRSRSALHVVGSRLLRDRERRAVDDDERQGARRERATVHHHVHGQPGTRSVVRRLMIRRAQDLSGRPLVCASAAYESSSRTCEVYRVKSRPDGLLPIRAADGKKYLEKFCLPGECPRLAHRYP